MCLLKSTVYFLPCSARDLYLSNVNCFLCIWWVYIVYNSKILHFLFGVHLFLEYQYSAANTMIWWIILKESIELAQGITERVLWRADWRHQVWQVLTLSPLRSPYQLSTLFKIPVHLWWFQLLEFSVISNVGWSFKYSIHVLSTILFPFIIRGQGDEQSGLEENEEVSSFFNLLTHWYINIWWLGNNFLIGVERVGEMILCVPGEHCGGVERFSYNMIIPTSSFIII